MSLNDSAPQPLKEQSVCPVSGERLGAHGPAVPVEIVHDFTEKPTFLQKVFHRTPEPNYVRVTIYVCCPECLAQVKSDPSRYSLAVYAERRQLGTANADPGTGIQTGLRQAAGSRR